MDEAPTAPKLPVLLNATRKAVLVTDDGGRVVALPRVVATPQVVDQVGVGPVGPRVTFGFPTDEDGVTDGAQFTLTAGVGRPDITLDLPPVLPGVFYLVEPDVLWRLRHRTDLMAIRAYEVNPAPSGTPEAVIITLSSVVTGLTATDVELPNVPFHSDLSQWMRDAAQDQRKFPPEEYERALQYWRDRLTSTPATEEAAGPEQAPPSDAL